MAASNSQAGSVDDTMQVTSAGPQEGLVTGIQAEPFTCTQERSDTRTQEGSVSVTHAGSTLDTQVEESVLGSETEVESDLRTQAETTTAPKPKSVSNKTSGM